jgi:hypothetical protein
MNKHYYCDENGLSLLENTLEYIKSQKIENLEPEIRILLLKIKHNLTWFLGNEIYDIDIWKED